MVCYVFLQEISDWNKQLSYNVSSVSKDIGHTHQQQSSSIKHLKLVPPKSLKNMFTYNQKRFFMSHSIYLLRVKLLQSPASIYGAEL